MIKEIRYGRSNHLKLVIPVYIRTNKKIMFGQSQIWYILMILKTCIHLNILLI